MIKSMTSAAVMWLVIAYTFPLHAQQKEGTLGTLWLEVEESYLGLQAQKSAIDASRLHKQSVKGNRLPQVNAQAQNTYGTHKGSAGAFFPQAGFFNVSGANFADGSSVAANSFGSAVVDWELFSFGKLRYENEAANAGYQKASSEKDAYLLSLKKTVSERYITLLYSDVRFNWAVKNTQRLEDIRRITSGLSAAGLRPAADSLLAASSYVQAMGDHDKWKGEQQADRIRLLEFTSNDSINYAASAERFMNSTSHYQDAVYTVRGSHPLLGTLDKQAEYYTLSGKALRSASLPSLHVMGGYSFRGTGIASDGAVSGAWPDGFSHATHNFLAGFGITWNVSGLYTNRLKADGLEKQAESTRVLHAHYAHAMKADLSASQIKVRKQYDQLKKTRLAVQLSEDAYQMYLARYKSGLISLSELLQLRLLLQQAENAHIEAARAYWMQLAHQAELTADFDFLFNNL